MLGVLKDEKVFFWAKKLNAIPSESHDFEY